MPPPSLCLRQRCRARVCPVRCDCGRDPGVCPSNPRMRRPRPVARPSPRHCHRCVRCLHSRQLPSLQPSVRCRSPTRPHLHPYRYRLHLAPAADDACGFQRQRHSQVPQFEASRRSGSAFNRSHTSTTRWCRKGHKIFQFRKSFREPSPPMQSINFDWCLARSFSFTSILPQKLDKLPSYPAARIPFRSLLFVHLSPWLSQCDSPSPSVNFRHT
ncbi:hypothetical protein BC830DRAFT_494194 [Chytriomyces sp. MP71]|nr:hypothetical protein BC830DRAFT_494194 [Chytriomyces sp. MP71]